MKRCSICQLDLAKNCANEYTMKHGHNAQPVNNGRCCDFCNINVVIPARMNLMFDKPEKSNEPHKTHQ